MMELDSYIDRYTGENRLRRLLIIAAAGPRENCNLEQRKRALNLAEQQLRLRDDNVLLYREIFGGGSEARRADPELFEGFPTYDANWANSTESRNNETRFVLEGRFTTAKSRLHKDAIRTACLALAAHDKRTGQDTFKSLADLLGKSRGDCGNENKNKYINNKAKVNKALYLAMDVCTTRVQTAQLGLLIIESALNAGDYFMVREYTGRVESTLHSLKEKVGVSSTISRNNRIDKNQDPNQDAILRDIGVKVQLAKGIERMVSGDYQTAANVLVALVMKESDGGIGSNNVSNENNHHYQENSDSDACHTLHWPGVTAPEDVALYAGLMCLVTRDRSKMIALADHPDALELVPSVKELLVHWSRANYAPCMRAFSMSSAVGLSQSSQSSLAPLLSQPLLPMGMVVDLYLTPCRWDALVQTIRETCLIEYIRPYQRVKLDELRNLFFPVSSPTTNGNESTLDALIDMLADLIDRDLLPTTTRLDCREGVLFQTKALTDPAPNLQAMEEKILDDTHAMLVRLACLEHDLGLASNDASSLGGKRGNMGGRQHLRSQKSSRPGCNQSQRSGILDSSEDEECVAGNVYETFAPAASRANPRGDVGDMNDTHMIDAESSHANSAMNPEDMY